MKHHMYQGPRGRRFRRRIIHAGYLICAVALAGKSLGAQVQLVSTMPSPSPFSEAGLVPPGIAGGDGNRPRIAERPGRFTRLAKPGGVWTVSLVALSTANALDIRSSWKKRELNPVLAQPSAAFGWQAALLKMGISGAVMGIEYFTTRHHGYSGLYRILSIANFGSAAAVGAVAAHNFTLPAAPR